jgi:hypothetical protein
MMFHNVCILDLCFINHFYNRIEATAPFVQSQQTLSNYHPTNTSSLIQTAAVVDQPQNMLIPTTAPTRGAAVPGLSSFYYKEIYPDKANRNQIYLMYFFIS